MVANPRSIRSMGALRCPISRPQCDVCARRAVEMCVWVTMAEVLSQAPCLTHVHGSRLLGKGPFSQPPAPPFMCPVIRHLQHKFVGIVAYNATLLVAALTDRRGPCD